MEIFEISASDKIVDKNLFGGKAFWLSWLIHNGYNVPFCFFLSSCNVENLPKIKRQLKSNIEFKTVINYFIIKPDIYDIAIRSSAIQEDSYDKSYAGHFKSFLGAMSFEQVVNNIGNVISLLL